MSLAQPICTAAKNCLKDADRFEKRRPVSKNHVLSPKNGVNANTAYTMVGAGFNSATVLDCLANSNSGIELA